MVNTNNEETSQEKIDRLKRLHERLNKTYPEKKKVIHRLNDIVSQLEYKNINQEIQSIKYLKYLKILGSDKTEKNNLKKDLQIANSRIRELTKENLKLVVTNSLNNAYIELTNSKKYFTEESLRYIVMMELSKNGFWGNFPNREDGPKLFFEYEYIKNKVKSSSKVYKPDIVSVFNGKECLLAIELKITNSTKDIDKCLEYLDKNKGKETYKFATVIYAIPAGLTDVAHHIEARLKKAKSKGVSEKNGKLLVGYFDWRPLMEKGAAKHQSKFNGISLAWLA
jgi:hypothetical protein